MFKYQLIWPFRILLEDTIVNKKSVLIALLFVIGFSGNLTSKEPLPPLLTNVGVEEHLDQIIPLELPFVNQNNETVKLTNYFDKNKITIVNLVYYNCPMLCNLVLSGVVESLNKLPESVLKKVQLLTISIDEKDTAEKASAYKEKYQKMLKNKNLNQNWDFLVGSKSNIKHLSNSLGFNFNYEKSSGEFAHSAVTFMLNSNAMIKRYLYGISINPFNLKMAILESKPKKQISNIERALLFCYNYSPEKRKYVLYAVNVMRVGGLITTIVILLGFLILKRRYR